MDLDEALRRIVPRLEDSLSPRRVAHSQRVAEYASFLCLRNKVDPARGRLAGLAHDICKEMSLVRQRGYAMKYRSLARNPLPQSESLGEKLVHGPASAGYLIEELDYADPDVLEATALHTLGGLEMCPLAYIVYAADKLEPGRRNVDPVFRQRCETLGPAELFFAVLENSLAWMKDRDMVKAEESLDLYDKLSRGGLRA